MKHIKLFEQVSSVLPKVFTTQEIKNMTQDEFFQVMEMYYREKNPEQAWTLMQVWTNSHREEVKSSFGFQSKLAQYANFINDSDPTSPRSGKIEQMDDLESI